jgi:hypothetical protein
MSDKKSKGKKTDDAAASLTGRIACLKIAADSCEFHVKNGKKGRRLFAVDNKAGAQFNAVIEVLSAAWAGRRKITVQPMAGEGMEKGVVSVSVGTLPKPPKPVKPAKSKVAELVPLSAAA